jgi:GNAT superfamily N-acetyltransferase
VSQQYPSGLSVERATIADLPDVQTILTDRCKWLSHRSISQWPGGGFPSEMIEKSLGRDYVYLVRVGKEIVGTFTLVDSDDLWQSSDEAFYIRRLATHSSWGGRDIGGAILGWIREYAAFEEKKFLRLACDANNASLVNYYQTKEFEVVDKVPADGVQNALLQRLSI